MVTPRNSSREGVKTLATINHEIVNHVNSRIHDLKNEVLKLNLPDFNSALGSMDADGNTVFSTDIIVAATIADRIIRKFEFPNASVERELKRSALRGWIDYENIHMRESNKRFMGDMSTRRSAYKASTLCRRWLRKFNYYIRKAPIDFGPGESFISRQGDCSIMAKLEPEYMTVSFNALDDYIKLVLRNRGLSQVYFEAFKNAKRVDKSQGVYINRDRSLIPYDDDSLSIGDQYKYAKIQRYLTDNDLITHGSRGSSVPKDNSKRRFINVEPSGNVILQKMYGWAIRQCLKEHGCDLDLGQAYHKLSIKNGNYSTIDWSSASDSILTSLVSTLLPRGVFDLLERARSEFTLVHDEEAGRKVYFDPFKISSMGNGYTFELLTLVNLSFARVLDKSSSVYGDDVIILNEHADEFVRSMMEVGFIPNMKKSFIGSPLRESCGAFFLETYGYITCYDIKYSADMIDAIRIMGKLRRIIEMNSIDHPIMLLISNCYESLLPAFPNHTYGPIMKGSSSELPEWVECNNHQQRLRRSKDMRRVYGEYMPLLEALASDYQVPVENFSILKIPVPRAKIREKVMDVVKYTPLLYAYIWSGKRTNMEFKVQKTDRKIRLQTICVDLDGYRVPLAKQEKG